MRIIVDDPNAMFLDETGTFRQGRVYRYVCAAEPSIYRGNSDRRERTPARRDPGAEAALRGDVWLYPTEPTGKLNLNPGSWIAAKVAEGEQVFGHDQHYFKQVRSKSHHEQRAARAVRMARKRRLGYA